MTDHIPILTLKPSAHTLIRNGHPWAFRNALMPHEELKVGTLVRLQTNYGYDCGYGFYHPTSQIAVRLLAQKEGEINVDFFVGRLQSAMSIRDRLFPTEHSYRLCFGESDRLPGLIIDRYGDYCAIQFLSAGMDARKEMIIQALQIVIPSIKGIIAKHDSPLRIKEGLSQGEELLFGEIPKEVMIVENGINLSLSLLHGQKTGYFLDQRFNRAFIGQLSNNLTVLDCFTNQGGFALNAAKGNAKSVLGIDSSAQAIQACEKNASLNNFVQCTFEQADVFDFLKSAAQESKKWDMVILDPPAFTKSKATLLKAKRGYAEINRQALKLINKGGFLVSASCSQHISEDMLIDIVKEEARRVNRSLRLLYKGGQSPCHPILPIMPETSYLKCLVFEVQ